VNTTAMMAFCDAMMDGPEREHQSANYTRAVRAIRIALKVYYRKAKVRPTGVNLRNGEITGWERVPGTIPDRFHKLLAYAERLCDDVSSNI